MGNNKITLEEFLNYKYKFEVSPYIDEEYDEEGFIISCSDLKGIEVFGTTLEEAHQEFNEAKIAWYKMATELGLEIKPPSTNSINEYSGRLTVRLPKSLHSKIDGYSKKESISLNTAICQLINLGFQNNENEKIIKKLNELEKLVNEPTVIKFVSSHSDKEHTDNYIQRLGSRSSRKFKPISKRGMNFEDFKEVRL